jgi:hypothetical protein
MEQTQKELWRGEQPDENSTSEIQTIPQKHPGDEHRL